MADPETPSPAPLDTKELQEAVSTIGPLAAEIIKIAKIAKKKGKAAAAAEFMKNVIPGTPLYTLVTQAIEGPEHGRDRSHRPDAADAGVHHFQGHSDSGGVTHSRGRPAPCYHPDGAGRKNHELHLRHHLPCL
jgi:hypothetical protein